MLAIGMLAAAAGLILGLRFGVIAFVLLTLSIAIIFAIGVWGGGSPLVIVLQMLAIARFRSDQLSVWLPSCCTSSHASQDALRPHVNPHARLVACFRTRDLMSFTQISTLEAKGNERAVRSTAPVASTDRRFLPESSVSIGCRVDHHARRNSFL